MQTRVISADAQPVLRALAREEASALLDSLLIAMQAGMQSPLPIARKTVCAWLRSDRNPAMAARDCYEGNPFAHTPGERGEDPCLARAWPSFDALHAGGFEHWLPLYQALADAVLPTGADA